MQIQWINYYLYVAQHCKKKLQKQNVTVLALRLDLKVTIATSLVNEISS
jgi:hypothetical protein